jgi:hypothetical protein
MPEYCSNFLGYAIAEAIHATQANAVNDSHMPLVDSRRELALARSHN